MSNVTPHDITGMVYQNVDLDAASNVLENEVREAIMHHHGTDYAAGNIGSRGISALLSGLSVSHSGWVGNSATITAQVITGERMSIWRESGRKVDDLTRLLDGGARYNPNHPYGTVLPRGVADFMEEAAQNFRISGAAFGVKEVSVF